VGGVYDRNEYHVEKKQAFEALAAEIARIVDPHLRGVPGAEAVRRPNKLTRRLLPALDWSLIIA
jgi:hypothetical protein